MPKSIVVLGSTGSIGTQTLDLVRANPQHFHVSGLAFGASWELGLAQVREFSPVWVAVRCEEAAEKVAAALPPGTELLRGDAAARQLCEQADYQTAVHGIVGAAGLECSLAVLQRGLILALANKESLVVAGARLGAVAREHGGEILPVDSELCAIHQCLRGERLDRVRRILLTASGGPFRDWKPEDIENAQPEQALKHPTWTMGKRISIGSATLMNKSLELLEVHHLFQVPKEQIEVVVHRQSIVHSMVEFVDGSVMAQLGPPDMRGPIHYCLHYPERVEVDLPGFDMQLFSKLTFEAPDPARFPALALGYRALELGSDAGCVLNAADEVAVEAYLDGRLRFGDIARVNSAVLERRPGWDSSLDELMKSDGEARRIAREVIENQFATV